MKKLKLQKTLILFLLIIFTTTISNASYDNVSMSVVEEPIATINFGTNSYVERSVISKDLENKEITLQLKVVNNEQNLKPTGEIMLVIDNSKSMLEEVTPSTTREDLVISSAKTLIENLLTDNTQLQIGIVSFSTNSDISKEGTTEDAKIISELTNDLDHLISSVENIDYDGPRTNLDAGINLAKQYFSDKTDNTHKYIIILSDGVPNVAIDYDKNYYSDDVISTRRLKSAEKNFKHLAETVFQEFKCALVHGRIDEEEQSKILNDFHSGKIQVLVATTVIEVGVDNPRATCMVIEQADHFGMSQLHQLRGRVGRGSEQSYCFMIYSKNITESGIERMKVLRLSNDGFYIAEQDLKNRGPGEMNGTLQSGALEFKIADVSRDKKMLLAARKC